MKRHLVALTLLLFSALAYSAPAGKVLVAGETLSYSLNMGPIKGGDAYLKTTAIKYNGKDAFKITLIAKTGKAAEKIFPMLDTLETIITPDIIPVYFHKHCFEGDDIVYETAKFTTLSSGKYRAELMKKYKNGRVKTLDSTFTKPVYDLVSIIAVARTMDTKNVKKGRQFSYMLAESAEIVNETLVYEGSETIRTGGSKYDCLAFSLIEKRKEKNGTTEKEILKIYVTDDERHIPVQIEIGLKFGKVKVKLQ